MFILTKAFLIPLGIGTATLAAGGGIATGIVLPRALAAKNALENWIPNGGNCNSLKGKDQINYVALGDSETAGYIGVLREDYLSYADFLAGSLKNAGKLKKYSNLALSGERLADFKKDIFQYPNKLRELHDADLITLTLGANDVLAYMKVLNIPFGQAMNFIGDPTKIAKIADGIAEYNKQSKKIEIKDKDNISDDAKAALDSLRPYSGHKSTIDAAEHRIKIFDGNNPNLGVSKKDSADMFTGTLDKLSNILNGSPQSLFNIDKDWYPRIFDSIKREYVTLIRDLHKAAPNAEIRVLGHAFPFSSFPQSVINNPKDSMQGDSLNIAFGKMLDAIKVGAEKNLQGKSPFVKFQNINDFPKFNSKLKPLKPAVDLKDVDSFKSWVTDNPMPNITDIHPSVYGHDLIAEDLYKDVAKEIGISDSEIATTTQHTNNSLWSRKDELSLNIPVKLAEFYLSSKTVYEFANMNSLVQGQDLIKPIMNNLLEYIKEPSIDGKKESDGDLLYKILPYETKKWIYPMVYKELKKNIYTSLIYKDDMNDPNVVTDSIKNQQKFADIMNLGITGLLLGLKDKDTKASYIKQYGENMINILTLKQEVTDLINYSKIIAKQLKEGIDDDSVSNEEQWTIAQVGIAKLFKSLFSLSEALSS